MSSRCWQDFQLFRVSWQHRTIALGISNFEKKMNILFLKTLKKITKNVTSQKLQRFEQSYLDARFATVESTLTGTKYRVGNFRFWEKINLNFLKIFEKIAKKVISRKLQRIEQSNLAARVAILDSTLKYPTTGLGISDFAKKINITFLKTLKKTQKTSYLKNYKDLNNHIWG